MSPWGWRQGEVEIAGVRGLAKDTRAWPLREEDTASCGLYKGTRGRQGTKTDGDMSGESHLVLLLWPVGKAVLEAARIGFGPGVSCSFFPGADLTRELSHFAFK